MNVRAGDGGFGVYASPTEGEIERHATSLTAPTRTPTKNVTCSMVYVPKGRRIFGSCCSFTAGSWKSGTKNLHRGVEVGHFANEGGIGCVICNYRLSPAVHYPAHYRRHREGVRVDLRQHRQVRCAEGAVVPLRPPRQRGHLVSLLATDPQYLKAESTRPTKSRASALA